MLSYRMGLDSLVVRELNFCVLGLPYSYMFFNTKGLNSLVLQTFAFIMNTQSCVLMLARTTRSGFPLVNTIIPYICLSLVTVNGGFKSQF